MLFIASRMRTWLEETHSTGFELRRHFFLRFFDSELVSSPGQWRVVAGGVLAILLSLSLVWVPAYYHKYLELNLRDTAEPLRMAALADALFLISLAMLCSGLFTALEWASLFPSLRDYLALAGQPVRWRDVFVAKFSALATFGALVTLAIALPPSALLPMVMAGPNAGNAAILVPAIFAACFLAGLFVFFSLVALQGIMLNLLAVAAFARVSLAMQGLLLTTLLCATPLVLSVPDLHGQMSARPDWAVYVPPLWFLGLEQTIAGNHEPLAVGLAWLALAGSLASACAAVLTYLWSYRRHRVRLLESSAPRSAADRRGWTARLADRISGHFDSREVAVFSFIGKTLARSRPQRLVLTAYGGLAVAMIFESFAGIVFARTFRGFSAPAPALRQAAISAPLALSLFLLCGFRYLFRLPVELRANWVFRVNSPGNRLYFLSAVERFLICWAVAPVAILTFPLEVWLLGPGPGAVATVLCLLPSLTLMELLLLKFEKIPFTSSYLPGQRPLVQTLLIYVLAVGGYVSLLSGLILVCLHSARATAVLFALLAAAWWRARTARMMDREIGSLEYEEVQEPAVLTLGIGRD